MSKQGDFLIYCVEIYKNAKKLSGKQVEALFTKYHIWNYLYDYFESLHTVGPLYIIADIDDFIAARKITI